MRRLGTLAFAGLAAATVAAFFIAQHLKVSDPLISGYPHTSPPVIAPTAAGCGGRFRVTRLSFYLQHRADNVEVSIIDARGAVVRTITRRRHMARNVRSLFTWDGRTDRDAIAVDGTYTWRIVLLGQGRSIQIATPVTVRDAPPQPRVTSVRPPVLVQGSATTVVIDFTGVSSGDRVTAQIYRRGGRHRPRPVTAFLVSGHDRAVWNGRVHGRAATPGTYLVGLTATDGACGTGEAPASASPPVRVQAR